MITNERLDEVEIRFWRPNPTGAGEEQHYFTILLGDAFIVGITPSFPVNFRPETAHDPFMETVAFSYRTITWTYMDGGVTFQDTVDDRP